MESPLLHLDDSMDVIIKIVEEPPLGPYLVKEKILAPKIFTCQMVPETQNSNCL